MKDKNMGHFNYSYKLENKEDPNSLIKGWWIETNEFDAYTNFWKSMVCGDVTDSIKGLEGKGVKFFESLQDWAKKYEEDLEEIIFREYIARYGMSQGIFEFQKNYRLLHLLENDEGFMREVGKLPEFPVITEVPAKQEVKKLDDLNF